MSTIVFRCPAPKCSYSSSDHRAFSTHENHCVKLSASQNHQSQIILGKRNRKNGKPIHIRPQKQAFKLDNSVVHTVNSNKDHPLFRPGTSFEATGLATQTPQVPQVLQQSLQSAQLQYSPLEGEYRTLYDGLPEAPLAPNPNTSNAPPQVRRVRLRVGPEPYETVPDSFGRYRVYHSGRPLTIPDSTFQLEDMSNVPEVIDMRANRQDQAQSTTPSDPIYPCPNLSAYLLQKWYWTDGAQKTQASRRNLVNGVLLHPKFQVDELKDINWTQLDRKLELGNDPDKCVPIWSSSTINVPIPPRDAPTARNHCANPTLSNLNFPIHNVTHRGLTDIIQEAFANNDPRFFHYEPFESRFRPSGNGNSDTCRLFGEVYESDQMSQDHRSVQNTLIDTQEQEKLPRCTAQLMIFSDAVQLGLFGNAKAWPVLAMFGNISKYERCRPDSNSWKELAYMPTLPAEIQDRIRELSSGGSVPKALLTHLRRELFHAVWAHLLDDKFLKAWKNGMVIRCADGITRRVFPRIFSYSADYPEKVLLSSIRGHNSICPCPRCLMKQADFHKLGLSSDQEFRKLHERIDNKLRQENVRSAREMIYKEGRSVGYSGIEDLLKSESLVPTQNAFSRRLSYFGFNHFDMVSVDFLHEVELGVWKSVFKHILRILHSRGTKTVSEFNARFRQVPTFGRGTIRKFSENVSEMTRPAARNYEDVLQCCIPVLEGLLPSEYESQVLGLIFTLAKWHGLAKLRQHSEITLLALEQQTIRLGDELRNFKEYTMSTPTYETPQEYQARCRRADMNAAKGGVVEPKSHSKDTGTTQRRQKVFNLNTVKLHMAGDIVKMIRRHGTTDSTTTQPGELYHRRVKRRYNRTNKNDVLPQLTRMERIEANLRSMENSLSNSQQTHPSALTKRVQLNNNEPIDMYDKGRSPYNIAQSQRNPVQLAPWTGNHQGDLAFQNFIVRLKCHILSRIAGRMFREEVDHANPHLAQLIFQHDRIYRHSKVKLNYTSYDVRRCQDTIRPCTPKCVALIPIIKSPNGNSQSPSLNQFWYAKVLGVFHTNIIYRAGAPQRIDFLWVRWLDQDTRILSECQLDRINYCRNTVTTPAFGFVDPIDVIRAAHLIPRFNIGRTFEHFGRNLSSMSIDHINLGDWREFYVNRFVDRDMLMRYVGFGIGHRNYTATTAVGHILATTSSSSIMEPLGIPSKESGELLRDSSYAGHSARHGLEGPIAQTSKDQFNEEDSESDFDDWEGDFDGQDVGEEESDSDGEEYDM